MIVTEKEANEVDEYIETLHKTNPKLASLIKELWLDVKDKPNDYYDQEISVILENMIERAVQKLIREFSEKWYVNEN